jgi:hypothetical protein
MLLMLDRNRCISLAQERGTFCDDPSNRLADPEMDDRSIVYLGIFCFSSGKQQGVVRHGTGTFQSLVGWLSYSSA